MPPSNGPKQCSRRLSSASRLALLVSTALVGCSGHTELAEGRPQSAPALSTWPEHRGVGGAGEGRGGVAPLVVIRADAAGRSIDERVFGTNVPAWLGPERLADRAFQTATVSSGVTLLRMPGGSWSNGYDVVGCERSDADRCYWTWAARPTDFVDFMQATQLPGMWTVSINATAQTAAASVAFFNGQVGDERVIGVDRNGVDWGTVGRWAELRAAGGNASPVPIRLWEIGNEVYGGKPGRGGDQCAEFGWEDVWTCDGAEYVRGDDGHDGFLAIRAAMLAVDPDIQVGAVGVADPESWSGWGTEVIESTGEALDFYSVHQYGFDRSPDSDEALQRPADMWPTVIASARSGLPADVPLAVTEYNMVSFEAGDSDHSMTSATNALYIADTIGQLVLGGVAIANQWNLANGTTDSGTDYGLIDLDDGSVFPQYHALQLWRSAGETLLVVEGLDAIGDLRVYPTRLDDGSLAIVMLNLDDEIASFDLAFAGIDDDVDLALRSTRADTLASDAMIEEAPVTLSSSGAGPVSVSIPPWSMNLMEVAVRG